MSSTVSFAAQTASAACTGFAEEVGDIDAGPVSVVGGGTHSPGTGTAGSASARTISVRSVLAPVGIVSVEPEELIVRCGAGTRWAELDEALAAAGLVCPLDPVDSRSTVGGVLSMGFSGVRRSRYGHIRDLLLETRYVSAQGILVKAGAPVVKNVTGYDLCRLLVGSQGTLGFLSEVVLRCRPRPAQHVWLQCEGVDPFAVRASLVAPGAVLWDGTYTYVLLEGTASEVRVGTQTLGPRWESSSAPVLQGLGIRRALRNSTIRTMAGRLDAERSLASASAGVERSGVHDSRVIADSASSLGPKTTATKQQGDPSAGAFLAEIGVGTVHFSSALAASPFDAAPLSAPVLALNQQLKAAFDPTGRLNPGVQPW
jgi:FAD/FMN-containing dehydrogenase